MRSCVHSYCGASSLPGGLNALNSFFSFLFFFPACRHCLSQAACHFLFSLSSTPACRHCLSQAVCHFLFPLSSPPACRHCLSQAALYFSLFFSYLSYSPPCRHCLAKVSAMSTLTSLSVHANVSAMSIC